MKVKWNLEYTTKSVYAIIVGCAVALFILIMLNISGIFDVFGVLPVSYTHLDVYKRQTFLPVYKGTLLPSTPSLLLVTVTFEPA